MSREETGDEKQLRWAREKLAEDEQKLSSARESVAHWKGIIAHYEGGDYHATRAAALYALSAPAPSIDAEAVAFPGIDGQVIVAASEMSEAQKGQPAWIWYDQRQDVRSFGRWAAYDNQAPYIRADIAALAPDTAARMEAEREAKEITLLHILNGMGGMTDSSESKWSWLNWFCDDNGQQTDTFNRCEEKGWLHTTHNSDTDCSTTTLTPAGRAALSETGGSDHG